METTPTARPARYTSIDLIKGIAMIMVILVHYGQNYSLGIAGVCQYMQMGCPIFFAASGFGMMNLINNRYGGTLNTGNLRQFYYSRFKALAPGWYVAVIIFSTANALVLYFTGTELFYKANESWPAIICNLLFLNGLLPFCNNTVVPGGWYIGATVIFYALTPAIIKVMERTKSKWIFFIISSGIGMALWSALGFNFGSFHYNGFSYFVFLVHYPEYLLGIILYYDLSGRIPETLQIEKHLRPWQIYFICIVMFAIAIALFYSGWAYGLFLSAWMTGFATYFTLHHMISKENTGDRKNCNPLEKIGRNSYYIFLVHTFIVWPFVQFALRLLEMINVPRIISFFILIPVTIFLSTLAGQLLRSAVQKITVLIFRDKTV